MNRRKKKKKGLQNFPTSRMIREQIKREIEAEALALEQRAEKAELQNFSES